MYSIRGTIRPVFYICDILEILLFSGYSSYIAIQFVGESIRDPLCIICSASPSACLFLVRPAAVRTMHKRRVAPRTVYIMEFYNEFEKHSLGCKNWPTGYND